MLAQNCHAYGALAGDHIGIIEGMHEGQAALLLKLQGALIRIAERVAAKYQFDVAAAKTAHRVDLHRRGGEGHDDHRLTTQAFGRHGHALGVIAGRGGDDAARPGLFR